MKVYVVGIGYHFTIVGIYTDEKEAQKYVDFLKNEKGKDGYLAIFEHELETVFDREDAEKEW